jgi:hypothetical protein
MMTVIDRGYTYTDVAARLGITRQAAWQRFGRKEPTRTGSGRSEQHARPLDT